MKERHIFFIGFGVGIVFTSLVAFGVYNILLNKVDFNSLNKITTETKEQEVSSSEDLSEVSTQQQELESKENITTNTSTEATTEVTTETITITTQLTTKIEEPKITTQSIIQQTTKEIETQKPAVTTLTTLTTMEEKNIETTTIKKKEVKIKKSIFD